MEKTVLFREFEERDIDFIFKCKNDKILNSRTTGQFKPFSYEEATRWVHGCMGRHDGFKFWAICSNDEKKRIVGWVSLSDIDRINNSAHFHGIVIADKEYQDGFAWIESYLFILSYAFETLGLHRLTGSYLENHPMSGLISRVMNFTEEGIYRNAIYKNGKYNNVVFVSILSDEYSAYKDIGGYDIYNIIMKITKLRKKDNDFK